MSHFTPGEIAYLEGQRLGRLATIDGKGELHVVPVGYRYNPATDSIDIGGRFFAQSRKYRDAVRYGRVAFVVDDVLAPGQPRGVEIRGRVEALMTGKRDLQRPEADDEMIRI